MHEPEMIRFKQDIIAATARIDMILILNKIDPNITTVAALKLLARTYELAYEKFANRKLRDVTYGEMEDAAKELMEIGMKELDFILADQR